MDPATEIIQKILLGLLAIIIIIYTSTILVIGVKVLTGDTSNIELMFFLLFILGILYLCFLIGGIGEEQQQETIPIQEGD